MCDHIEDASITSVYDVREQSLIQLAGAVEMLSWVSLAYMVT